MSDSELITHLGVVESGVGDLSPSNSVAFAAACVERQKAVFCRALEGQSWLAPSAVALDEVLLRLWDIAKRNHLEGLDSAALSAGKLMPADLQPDNGPLAVVFFVANGLRDLIGAFADGDFAYAHFKAARNLELIEMLADEESVDLEELQRLEVARQLDDLHDIARATSDSDVESLRESATRNPLYREHWFSLGAS